MSADALEPRPHRWAGRGSVRIWLVVAAIGAVVFLVGLLVDPRRALYGYLTAFAFVASVVLGALVLLATVHAMNAGWPIAVRRLIESMTATMPAIAVLSIPILAGMKWLYPWMTPESFTDAHTHELVEHRLAYLNAPFFLARAVVLLAVWIAIALALRRWSLRQDVEADPELGRRMRLLSGGALPVLGITISVGAFDWLMSLTPEWYTTMYGIYFFSGGFLGAIAALVAASFFSERSGAIPALRRSHYYALGRLLFAFTVFWAYIAYFQFFIIWIGNRPTEASWYLDRVQHGWAGVSVALAVGQFAVPFLVLLPYAIKQSRVSLVVMAVWVALFHYVDCYWLVMPALRAGPAPSWMDLGGLLFVVGATAAYAVRAAAPHALVARGDPRLAEALAYASR